MRRQHFLLNATNEHFPNRLCMVIQNHSRIKHSFKEDQRDFNVIEYEKFSDMILDSTLQQTFENTTYQVLI